MGLLLFGLLYLWSCWLALRKRALAGLDQEPLAGREGAVAHRDLVEHLEFSLPVPRRHDITQIAALVVEEFDVRLLGDAALEVVVDVVAVAVGGDRRADQFDAERGRFLVQEI